MYLKYIDTNQELNFPIQDPAKAIEIEAIVKPFLIIKDEITGIDIDLSDESIEEVKIYSYGRRLASMGGAVAWNTYRRIAAVFPDIDHHKAMPAASSIPELLRFFGLS